MNDSKMPGGPQLFAFVRTIAPAAASPYSPGFDYIDAPGAFLRTTEANIPFVINIDGQGDVPWGIAHEYACPPGEWFRRIKVSNPSATEPLKVTMLIGRGAIKDDRLAIVRERPAAIMPQIEAEIEVQGWAGSSIAATSGETFTPTITGRRIRQKGLIVANNDPNAALQLRDAAGEIFALVPPNQTHGYVVAHAVTVFNSTAGAVSCHVGQMYWLTPADA